MIVRLFHADKTVARDLAEAVGPQRGLVLATQMQGVRALRFEDKTPYKEILEAAGDRIDFVAVIDEGRPEGMWRDPFGDLCDRLFSTRREAAEAACGYVLMRFGRAIAYFRKALWDPLDDAEQITDYLSRIVPGIRPYRRPPAAPPPPPPRPKKPRPKRTPIINPATGRPDPELATTTAEMRAVDPGAAPGGDDEVTTAEGGMPPPPHDASEPQPPYQPAAEPPPLDPYVVLGIRKGVGLEEVKKAYRALVLQYHPDKVAHLAPEFRALAEERTREINDAWARLEKELGG